MRLRLGGAQRLDRVGHDLGDGQFVVGEPVHEGGVGAVLEQAADEIGQQVLVAADRRVDAAGHAQAVRGHHLLVERLAHAVEALELEVPVIAGQHRDGRDGMGVVGRELGVEQVPPLQQAPRASEIRHIGRAFAGEDGVAVEPGFLCALDLAVPVGALHEAHGHAPSARLRGLREPVDHGGPALAIGLHCKAEPVPAAERRLLHQRAEQLERQVEPLLLLGVDGEADSARLGEESEFQDRGQKLAPHALLRPRLVARVQRGELHRYRGLGLDIARVGGGAAHGLDGARIGGMVAAGVRGRHGGLAQHVIGEAVTLRGPSLGEVERLADVAPEHELLAHDPHGVAHGLPDHRLARPGDEPLQRAGEPLLARTAEIDDAAREHEPPGRGVHDARIGGAQMPLPVAPGDLVGDEPVGGLAVGNAQQRFGEAHQHHALLAGQRVFVHEGVDAAIAAPARPRGMDQPAGKFVDAPALRFAQPRLADQPGIERRLVGERQG